MAFFAPWQPGLPVFVDHKSALLVAFYQIKTEALIKNSDQKVFIYHFKTNEIAVIHR